MSVTCKCVQVEAYHSVALWMWTATDHEPHSGLVFKQTPYLTVAFKSFVIRQIFLLIISFKNEIWWQPALLRGRPSCMEQFTSSSFWKTESLYSFKCKLKTHLFTFCFNDWLSVFVYFRNFCNAFPVQCWVGRVSHYSLYVCVREVFTWIFVQNLACWWILFITGSC